MQLDESRLRAVQDGRTLCRLDCGIEIVRRKKHEPINIEGLSREELVKLTDKENGAKFLPGTTLAQIVDMTAQALQEGGAQPGATAVYNKKCPKPIGVSRGRKTCVLRVTVAGGFAHGYPVGE